MSTSRPAPAHSRPHPAVADRRRAVARARGRRRRSGMLLALGGLLLLATLYWAATGPLVSVHGVAVSGYDRPDRAELEKALAAAAGDGTVLAPATGSMTDAARRFPWVASITVTRRWPRALSVHVVETVPVAVAAFEDQAVLVSPAGRVLDLKGGDAGVGWLRLAASPPPIGESLPDDALAGLRFIAAAPPEVGARVRALHVTPDGLLQGGIDGGPELRLGRPERVRAKAEALGLLLAGLSAEEESTTSYIDLSVPGNPALGPVVTPSQ